MEEMDSYVVQRPPPRPDVLIINESMNELISFFKTPIDAVLSSDSS